MQRCLISIAAPELRKDAECRLIEDPLSLRKLEEIARALKRFLKDRADIGDLTAIEGEYSLDIYIDATQPDVWSGEDVIKRLIEDLHVAAERIDQTSLEPLPRTAAGLGLRDEILSVLRPLTDLGSWPVRARIRRGDDADGQDLPAPSVTALRALPKALTQPKCVDGRVTGVGRDEQGTRIEVNNKAMMLIRELSLDDAISTLRQSMNVRGVLIAEDGAPELTRAQFYRVSENGHLEFGDNPPDAPHDF